MGHSFFSTVSTLIRSNLDRCSFQRHITCRIVHYFDLRCPPNFTTADRDMETSLTTGNDFNVDNIVYLGFCTNRFSIQRTVVAMQRREGRRGVFTNSHIHFRKVRVSYRIYVDWLTFVCRVSSFAAGSFFVSGNLKVNYSLSDLQIPL